MTDTQFYITWILLLITMFTATVKTMNEDDVRSRTKPQRIRLMRMMRRVGN